MSQQLAVLVNPSAGRGAALRKLQPLVAALRDGGADVQVVRSVDADDARVRAAELVAAGPDALVALGGDGTVHFALQAVAGTDVPLGIVPVGTGNDIAAALGVPRRDIDAAARVVLAGHSRRIDAARSGDQWYVSVLCTGFASRVNERANLREGPLTVSGYLRAVLAELRTLRPVDVRLTVDGEPWDTRAMIVAVANTNRFGAGMRPCPDAVPDDGMLDVGVIGPLARTPFLLRIIARVYRGTHVSHPAVRIRRAKKVTIDAADDVAYADGERLTDLPVSIEVVPAAVSVLVPQD